MVTLTTSPGFISRTSGVGVKVASVCWSGPGGPTGVPLWVRYAKLTGSGQLLLAIAFGGLPGPCRAPYWACRLSMVSAPHHCFGSHEIFEKFLNGPYPGG